MEMVTGEFPTGFVAPVAVPWIEETVGSLQEPIEVTQLTGGHSNLTYRIADSAGRTLVLRRPPMGNVLPTAHDMSREHRVVSAVGSADFPVPRVHGYRAGDDDMAEFYVMDHVDGTVLESGSDAAQLSPEARGRASEQLIDTLVALHRIDPDSVGLGDLSRRSGYVERQLKRWRKQWEATKTEDRPVMDRVHAWLVDHVPESDEVTIVHGDCRFGNAIFESDGRLAAMLDWELCTLGDPLADLGYVLLNWDEPADEQQLNTDAPTTVAGFWNRQQALERYAECSGRDVSGIDYYVALQAWRLACINQGVYSRYLDGDSGMVPTDLEPIRDRLDRLVDRAATLAGVDG